MSFKEWIDEADKDLEEAIGKKDKEIFKEKTHKNFLLPYYLQYRILKENRRLSIATWVLAIATIIIILINLYGSEDTKIILSACILFFMVIIILNFFFNFIEKIIRFFIRLVKKKK